MGRRMMMMKRVCIPFHNFFLRTVCMQRECLPRVASASAGQEMRHQKETMVGRERARLTVSGHDGQDLAGFNLKTNVVEDPQLLSLGSAELAEVTGLVDFVVQVADN